jgi:hypothetical protein
VAPTAILFPASAQINKRAQEIDFILYRQAVWHLLQASEFNYTKVAVWGMMLKMWIKKLAHALFMAYNIEESSLFPKSFYSTLLDEFFMYAVIFLICY